MASAATVQNSSEQQHSGHHSEQKATKGATGHACSATGSHNCCSKKAVEPKPEPKRVSNSKTNLDTVGGSSSGMMQGCPLALGKATLAAKIRENESAAAPIVSHSILRADDLLEQTSPLSPPARLPNRGHTYLRCCVFLI
jgi:hypothetical protein